jgi:protein-tyrosine-phosphatase
MAEALLRHIGGDAFDVYSAGTRPTGVSPEAVEVMREHGLDISQARSKPMSEFDAGSFDYVMTLCDRANEECPTITAKVRRLHWALPDPAAPTEEEERTDRLEAFRRVRNALEEILTEFVHAHRQIDTPP